ncbi:MAG: hypothetical protein IPK17_19080 [Chloroflexi bacterium]|nr:hypothetical protein [Chloroflexota bacterium]
MTTLIVMKNGKLVDRVDVSANIGEQGGHRRRYGDQRREARALNGGQPSA